MPSVHASTSSYNSSFSSRFSAHHGCCVGAKQRLIFAVVERWSSANNYQVGQCSVAYNACIVKRPARVWRVFARYSSRGVLELIAFHAHFRVQSSPIVSSWLSFDRRREGKRREVVSNDFAQQRSAAYPFSRRFSSDPLGYLLGHAAGTTTGMQCDGGPHRAASDSHAAGSHTEGGESSNRSVDQSTPPSPD